MQTKLIDTPKLNSEYGSSSSKRIKTVGTNGSPSNCTQPVSVTKPGNKELTAEEHCYQNMIKLSEKLKSEKFNKKIDVASAINEELLSAKSQRMISTVNTCIETQVQKSHSDVSKIINENEQTCTSNEATEKVTRLRARRNSERIISEKTNFKSILRQNSASKNMSVLSNVDSNIVKTEASSVSLDLKTKTISTEQVSSLKQNLPRRSKNKEPTVVQKEPTKPIKKSKHTQQKLPFQATTATTKNTSVNSAARETSNLNTFACLRNLGSTCYMNCIIQVMRYTPGFAASIHRLNKQIDYLESLNVELEHEITCNNNAKFVKGLHQLLVEMTDKEKQDRRPIISPAKFVKTVWTLLTFWSNGSQQDAHEFLQYTIHFINECDTFIRKLQQQHQIKSLQLLNESDFSSPPKTTASTTPSKMRLTSPLSVTPTTRQTKNSMKTATQPNSDLSKTTTTTDSKEIVCDQKMEIAEQTNIQVDNIKKEVSDDSKDSMQIVINQQLSARLVKSMPQIPKSINSSINGTDSFLRTPTKGGASAYNSTSCNAPGCVSKPQSGSKLSKIEPLISPPPPPALKATKTSKSPLEATVNNRKAEELYSFDKVNKGLDIFKSSEESKKKKANDLYDFDLNESMEIEEIEQKIADKDLVSKCLKETILKNENKWINISTKIKPRRSVPSTDFEYKQSTSKKMKCENGMRAQLNDSMNSIIIIDSENEEEEIIKAPRLSSSGKKHFTAERPTVQKDQPCSKKQIKTKKFSVLIKPLNLKKILLENKGIKIADKVFDYFDQERPVKAPQPKILPEKNNKKLRSKAKTLPVPVNTNTINATSNDHIGSVFNRDLIDLNAITLLNPVSKPVNVMNNNGILSTNPITNFKSKLRSTASTAPRVDPVPSLSICSLLPPSPAELLRKYSTSNGYTCEMDKLFKGSSVTVTQCLECENLRKCPEAFYDRSIPIDTNDDTEDGEQTGVNWIVKCLSNESYLNDNSKYRCDKCQSKQEAKIHTQYTEMPNILILHLLSYGITSSIDGNLNAQKLSNRLRLVNYFDYTSIREALPSASNKRTSKKSHDWIKSPIASKIKMHQNISNENNFTLFAVVMHSGATLNSGHYTAFVNYKIISQSISTTYSNEFSTLFSSNNTVSGKRNDSSSCSCSLDTNKNLNPNTSTLNSLSNNNDTSSTKKTLSQPASTDSELQWLHFDDTKVKSLTDLEFQRKIVDASFDSPYILFYVKK